MNHDIISQLKENVIKGYNSKITEIQFANINFLENGNAKYSKYAFDKTMPSSWIRPEILSVDKIDKGLIEHLIKIEMSIFMRHLQKQTAIIKLKTKHNKLYETLEEAFTKVNQIAQPDVILIPRKRYMSFMSHISNLGVGQSVILREDLKHIMHEVDSNEFYIYRRNNITKNYPKDETKRLTLNIEHNEGITTPTRFSGHIQQELRITNCSEIAQITVTT